MSVTKNINIQVSEECYKKLKIIAIEKDTSLKEIIKNILEKSVSRKVIENVNE